jgi:hypothetical protein
MGLFIYLQGLKQQLDLLKSPTDLAILYATRVAAKVILVVHTLDSVNAILIHTG